MIPTHIQDRMTYRETKLPLFSTCFEIVSETLPLLRPTKWQPCLLKKLQVYELCRWFSSRKIVLGEKTTTRASFHAGGLFPGLQKIRDMKVAATPEHPFFTSKKSTLSTNKQRLASANKNNSSASKIVFQISDSTGLESQYTGMCQVEGSICQIKVIPWNLGLFSFNLGNDHACCAQRW